MNVLPKQCLTESSLFLYNAVTTPKWSINVNIIIVYILIM
jgi:hypothetical protein